MKKMLFLVMALVVVAFALPALAQSVNDNDIYENTNANGNAIGYRSTNNQYQNANFGDISKAPVNKSNISINNNGAGNSDNSDNSYATFMNKSSLSIDGVGNNNQVGNQDFYLGVDLTAVNSANNNTVYAGNMMVAFQNQYQFTHQFDHQMAFGAAFQETENCNFFIPIQPIHLSQTNTGITAGNGAGAVVGISSNAFNAGGGSIQGMFGTSLNLGGIAQNQAAANVVTAFSAQ
jgi:hypothetical protein